jgi:preprotein translocase subunit SecY
VSGVGYNGSLGLFEWQLPGVHPYCVEIADVQNRAVDDTALKCARVCALLALCFGAILLVFGFFKQCLCPLPCSQLLMDLLSTCVQIMLASVYVVWLTDACDEYYCNYGDGAIYLILTQIFWLAAG